MFKRQAIAVAILASQAIVANAAPSIAADPWVFYAPNPVSTPAATPASAKRIDLPMDPWVFYSPNPVANKVRAEATGSKSRQLVQINSEAHYFPGGISW